MQESPEARGQALGGRRCARHSQGCGPLGAQEELGCRGRLGVGPTGSGEELRGAERAGVGWGGGSADGVSHGEQLPSSAVEPGRGGSLGRGQAAPLAERCEVWGLMGLSSRQTVGDGPEGRQ